MRTKIILVVGFLLVIILSSCGGCKCGNPTCKNCKCKVCKGGVCNCSPDTIELSPMVYNLYIENSGSMKGYFSGNSNLKVIIKEYYDRIVENFNDSDEITLNYINTGIQRCETDIQSFLISAQGACNASYTKLGDILAMSMDNLSENCVNLLISDFTFTSDNGLGIQAAESEITKLFATRLNKDEDISIAIMKYDCDFSGTYYPGAIPCNHDLPIYIWIFGKSENVKAITNLPIKESAEMMTLQAAQTLEPTFKVKNARMLDKKTNSIMVGKWPKNRDGNSYSLQFTIDMSSILMDENYLEDKSQYSITDGYSIDSIVPQGGNTYLFTISINKPSPKTIEISLPYSLPEWVEESNFTSVGIPPSGQTQNVKYLLEGVYDAFHNSSDKSFNIDIKLIK